MGFNFPNTPVSGDVFTPPGGPTWRWNGFAWTQVSASSMGGAAIGDSPPADPQHGQLWWESDTGRLFVWYVDVDSAQWVQTVPEGGGGGSSSLSGLTVDTGELYRLIMLSNGSVFAIPYAAVPPTAPTGLVATVRLTSVSLNWAAVAGAVNYSINRDGVPIGTTSDRRYRDTTITLSHTYSYTVSSIDTYRQRSPASSPVTAFIDPVINVAPTNMLITCWPTPIPTDGPAIIRVNAREIDVQTIAFTLGVDAGSLTATADPSVWVFAI